MARLLPNVGYVYYNGFRFPGPFFAEVRADMVMDTSRRFIKYTKYNITIRTLIVPDDFPSNNPGGRVDDNLENIRCKLEKAGGAFIFVQQGIGDDFAVNCSAIAASLIGSVPSFDIDPCFGPFPKILSWAPKGSNRACEIVWTVEVTIPECCGSDAGNAQFLEFSYSTNWAISPEGATTRTITGYYEIPNTRRGANAGAVDVSDITATGDNEWDQVFAQMPRPSGFNRTSSHSVSLDKRQINFTITDTEIQSDNPLFPYMVSMDITHTVSAAMPELWKHQNTLSGTIKIAPGTPRHWAYLAFASVAKERYDKSANLPTFTAPGMKSDDSQSAQPNRFLSAYSFEEQIFGREFRFSITWWFLAKLTDIFKGSGLFSKVTSGNPTWAKWNASMGNTQSSRGLAKMGATYGEGSIVSACGSQQIPNINGNAAKTGDATFVPNFIATQMASDPPKDQSYLAASIEIESDTQVPKITHIASVGMSPADASMPASGDALSTSGVSLNKLLNESQNASSKTVQILGNSTTTTYVKGTLIRVAYLPSVPVVNSVGGVTPVAQRIWQNTKIIGRTHTGKAIYAMRYMIELDLPNKPGSDILSATVTDGDPGSRM